MKNSCTKMHVLRKNLVILQAIWRNSMLWNHFNG